MKAAATGRGACAVHIGTFKTGTTAIQRYLAHNAVALERAGLYVPEAGVRKGLDGHHNLASELSGAPDFDASGGGLADVVAEIVRAGPPNVVLSSEAFALLHDRPEPLVRLRDALASAGYRVRIVLYVRAQPDYLQSLYDQGIKQGHVETMPALVDEVVETGALKRGGQVVLFDYSELAERFRAVFGDEAMVVRGYRGGGRAEAIIVDFLAAVGIAMPDPRDVVSPPTWENVGSQTGTVIAKLFANADELRGTGGLSKLAAHYLAQRPDLAAAPFRPLGNADRRRIERRFAKSNARVVNAYGVAPETFDVRRAYDANAEQAALARAFFVGAQKLLGPIG